jgi:phage terminase large subunit
MFKHTTAIKKLRAMQARKKVVQGGTSGGKTYGILPVIADKLIKESRLKATVVAETLPAVKEGPLDIFKAFMYDTNRWIESHWNASSLTYTFSSGSRIQFKSFDSVGKAKSSGKRDILFLNEANHISFEIADALMIRSKETWIDFNPDNKFWVHDEVLTSKTAEFLLLTYEDNEGLSPETLEDLLEKKDKAFYNTNLPNPKIFEEKNIKNEYWANWCKVYIYGEIGNLEGVIFTNWKIIDNLPANSKYVKSGLDFGFTNDPTTCIDKYIHEGVPIYDEVLYEKGLTNSAIAAIVKKDFKRKIIADSSEPKSITEIKGYGVSIEGAVKGPDSIKFGIQTLQKEEFLVTARSLNLINELRKYRWVKSKDGKNINVPIDAFNHCIDPMRYINEGEVLNPKTKVRKSGYVE